MNERPWMTALEKQFAALAWMRANKSSYVFNGPVKDDDAVFENTIDGLLKARAFAWSADTVSAVTMASRTVPAHARLPFRQTSDEWWYLGSAGRPAIAHEALLLSMARTETKPLAILLGMFSVAELTESSRGFIANPTPVPIQSLCIGYDEDLQSISTAAAKNFQGEQLNSVLRAVRFVFAGCVWLEQRVAVSSLGPIERHRRKQLARDHNAPLPSDVNVIQLRRHESQAHYRTDHSEDVDWSCRWIVNGHWRNQPYKEERKLIYIMPHVKGPADMPLKVPTHTVYQVSR